VSDQTSNALIAVALGSVAAVILLIPVAAVQYRLDGRLGPRDLAILLTAAIYGLALWTYTLLPMPVDGTFACKGAQTTPLDSLRLITWRGSGPADLLRQSAFLQIALNVLLFVPLGYFVRIVLRRGVVVATGLGFGISLLIETTQRSGVWNLYDCAYRLFDVDDLLVNTAGATIGSLVSILLVRRRRGEVVLPTSISYGRRLVGFACDALFIVMSGAAAGLGYRAWQLYVRDVPIGALDLDTQVLLQWSVPLMLEAALVLLAGRTVGELVISVHTVARRRPLLVPSRLVKLAFGVGPLFVVAVLDPLPAALLLAAYLILTLAVAGPTRGHRGLSHVVAGLDLRIGDDSGNRSEERPARSGA
jgi:glycopeptide antibiotics resistance protein